MSPWTQSPSTCRDATDPDQMTFRSLTWREVLNNKIVCFYCPFLEPNSCPGMCCTSSRHSSLLPDPVCGCVRGRLWKSWGGELPSCSTALPPPSWGPQILTLPSALIGLSSAGKREDEWLRVPDETPSDPGDTFVPMRFRVALSSLSRPREQRGAYLVLGGGVLHGDGAFTIRHPPQRDGNREYLFNQLVLITAECYIR